MSESFWVNSTFVEATEEKLVGGDFLLPHPEYG